MNISLVLVHNQGIAGNVNQINKIKSLITLNSQIISGTTGSGKLASYTRYYWTINNLPIQHELYIYQIVPYGVTVPTNFDTLQPCYSVYYGEDNKDKTGTHPRFFNWAIKRGVDHLMDIVIYIEDFSQFSLANITSPLTQVTTGGKYFAEIGFGKLCQPKLRSLVGELKETLNYTNAMTDFKNRLTLKGL